MEYKSVLLAILQFVVFIEARGPQQVPILLLESLTKSILKMLKFIGNMWISGQATKYLPQNPTAFS